MQKLRLNKAKKKILLKAAKKHFIPKKEKEAYEKAFESLKMNIQKAIDKKCPENEMKILKKYKCTRKDYYFEYVVGDKLIRFRFHDCENELYGFTTPRRKGYSFWLGYPGEDSLLHKDFLKWEKIRNNYDHDAKMLENDYEQLINTAIYLEDITEIWPEADNLRPQLE